MNDRERVEAWLQGRSNYNEADHPRDENGQWTDGGGSTIKTGDKVKVTRLYHKNEGAIGKVGPSPRKGMVKVSFKVGETHINPKGVRKFTIPKGISSSYQRPAPTPKRYPWRDD